MATGTVKFFNSTKGFGFIHNNEDGKDYFVHFSNSLDKIRDNDKVEFEIEEGDRGPKCVNVKRVK